MNAAVGEVPGAEPARTFEEAKRMRRLPLPRWLVASVATPMAAAALFAAIRERDPAQAVVRGTFLASAMGYLSVSLLDFALHFRMERERTGHAIGWKVIPLGESVNHVLTVGTLASLLALARKPRLARYALRDRWTLAAPALFLALGWRDELVYHRRRTDHREDMLHTVSHLAAGVMLTSFMRLRMAPVR